METLRANDFELGFPDDWRDESQVVLLAPARPDFTPNLQVHREALPEQPLAEFFQQQRAELAALDGFRLVGHGERALGGEPALYHDYSWQLPGGTGVRVRQAQVVATRGGALFTVTMSALEPDWEAAAPTFEAALAEFRWT